MSRAIKVEDQVYMDLDMIRGKGETYSQVVERLLEARLKMFELLNMIEGVLKYQEWKQTQVLKAIDQLQEQKGIAVEVDK